MRFCLYIVLIAALLAGCRDTGYYDYDTNPAYVVGPTTVESVYTKGYLPVFETDKENGKVERIFFVPAVE